MARRPRPVGDAGVRASVVRGPRADGRWYWTLRATTEGKRRKLASGWWSRDEAALRCAEHAAARTAERRTIDDAPTDVRTVADLLQCYGGHLGERVTAGQASRHTLKEADRSRRQWTRALGHLPLPHVTTRTLEAYQFARLREVSAATVGLEMVALTAAWRWALGIGAIHLPVPTRPRLTVPAPAREHTPTAEEVDAVLAWMRAWDGEIETDEEVPGREAHRRTLRQQMARRCADMLQIQRIYGARIGEVAGLTVGSVGPSTILLDGKTGPRTLPLADEARPLLGPRLDGRDADAPLWGVAPATATRYVWATLARATAALGQPTWTPHALRALWADEAEAGGLSLLQIAAWQGNSPVVVARHYRRVRAPELSDIARRRGLVSNVESIDARKGGR